ncbi:hypothetical protein STAB901_00845 [Streptococcus pyogenes STAB901]|nr:hypothetical protein STAB901_00845 [Streptococcus pyogenes STAB901]
MLVDNVKGIDNMNNIKTKKGLWIAILMAL